MGELSRVRRPAALVGLALMLFVGLSVVSAFAGIGFSLQERALLASSVAGGLFLASFV